MATTVAEQTSASISRWYPRLQDAVIDGRRLRYLDAGEGPAVLLVHGIGCSWTHWAANLDALTPDHRVIAVDLPGFGGSDPLPPSSQLTVTAHTLITLLDQLGVEETAIVGHSLGGLVSWLVTTTIPDRITHLALVDSATVTLTAIQTRAILHGFTFGNSRLSNPKVARAILRRPRLRKLVLASLFADHSAVTPELAVALLTPLTAAPGFLDALHAAAEAITTADPAVMATRTLIVWGTKDPVFSVGQARRLAAAMANAEMVEIPGARHWPQLEQPARFNDVLRTFLGEPAVRTPASGVPGTR